MSTLTPVSAPPVAVQPPLKSASDELISQRIAEACRALWWAEITRQVLRMVIVVIASVLLWVVVDQWIYSPGIAIRSVASLSLMLWAIWYVVRQIVPVLTSSIHPAYAARSLERDVPEMKQELTSYVTLRGETTSKGLRNRVVRSIGSTAAGRLQSHDALPTEATGTLRWWIAAAAALALLAGYAVVSPKSTVASASRLIAPLSSIDPAKRVSINDVRPGDAETIAGRAITVSAEVVGLRDDESVWCRWESASQENEFELKLDEASLRYQGDLQLDHDAVGKIPYRIHAGDDQVGPFWLTVDNVPVVALQSVHYQPPEYTGEVPHTSSSGAITAIDGTNITILAKTNRPIAKANIEFNPRMLGETVRATAGKRPMTIDADGTTLTASFPLRSARGRSAAVQYESYRIRVWDDSDQSNPKPIVYPIRVIADLPPEVAIVIPRKSPKSMAIDLQQIIEVHAMDPDFGLKQVELEIRRGIDVIKKPTLWSEQADGVGNVKGNRVTEFRFRPSEHGLRIGDVVQIVAVATDNRLVPEDPSIEPNVTVTDPVELRIIESQPQPQNDDPTADDGLSTPDQRPPSDHQPAQDQPSDNASSDKSESESGDQTQSGSGSKDGSGQQQPGEGQSGEGQSGEGQSGEGQSGEGQSGEGQSGEGQSGEGQNSESAGSKDNGQPNGTGNKTNGSGKPSDSQHQGGPADNAPSNRSTGESGTNRGDATTTGESNGTKQDSANTDPSASDEPNGQPNVQPNDRASDRGNNTGAQSGNDNNKGGQSAGDPSDGNQAAENKGPPKHDGEAFEKIRDYLEKKQQQQKHESPGSGASQGNKPQGSSEQPAADKTGQPDQGSPEQGSNTDGTKPDGARPDGARPDGARPDGARPDGARPDGARPDGARPDGANEDGTNRDGTQPDGTKPDGTKADGTKPDGTKPDGANSDGTQPDGTKPDGTAAEDQNPDGQNPDGQNPDGQNPDGQNPDGQNPDGQNPDVQNPDGTDPDGMQPNESGDQPAGDDSRSGSSQNGTGEQGAKPKQGDQNQDSGSPAGEGAQGNKADNKTGDQDSAKPDGENDPADKRGDQSGKPRPTGNDAQQGGSPPNQAQQPGKPSNDASSNSQGGNASGTGADTGTGDGGEGAPPPAPADLEYTKKATDMVLDYLDETRDAPDSELLEQLDWTEQDLKRFADRWQKTRELGKPGSEQANQNKEIEEALQSLGLRPPATDSGNNTREAADALRSIRDAGNRKPPPAAYRDLFDSFRRGLGRQK